MALAVKTQRPAPRRSQGPTPTRARARNKVNTPAPPLISAGPVKKRSKDDPAPRGSESISAGPEAARGRRSSAKSTASKGDAK
jgi:hypothetical protein